MGLSGGFAIVLSLVFSPLPWSLVSTIRAMSSRTFLYSCWSFHTMSSSSCGRSSMFSPMLLASSKSMTKSCKECSIALSQCSQSLQWAFPSHDKS